MLILRILQRIENGIKITSQQPTHSKVPSIIAAIICLALALWSLLWFWSSVLTVRPEAVITQWEQNKENKTEDIDQELAIKMVARLKQSIAINPLDANSHFILARFYEQLAFTEVNKKPQAYIKLAEQEYKEAIINQPSWDYAWARLSILYSKTDQDKLAIIAINNSIDFGPFERNTQQLVLPLLFKYWSWKEENSILNHVKARLIISHIMKFHLHTNLAINSAKKYNELSTLLPLAYYKNHQLKIKKLLGDM